MLTTKRYDYVPFDAISIHPNVNNHRRLDERKVQHYRQDILSNGLLEPLIVWEKRPQEFFLVGGFHRLGAIKAIREQNSGYFDRVDVRVVSGDLEEIRALNLKLNADRLDTKITDYFETVIFLNNANWERERIAGFLDRSEGWIGEIIRYAPQMNGRLKGMLEGGEVARWGAGSPGR
ncbi:MAG: ParB-like nuclease domain-containing protein [Deltaproteobacteria bacterium]|nr:ParB-like nuclease domain-containing protein [Deltaproteobacteria bacterium]